MAIFKRSNEDETMKITDIKDMPNFNPEVKNGMDSVSTGRVMIKDTVAGQLPHCARHGALNKMSKEGIWRCIMCNEGCFEVE